jgi:hypothetical protein
MMVDIRKTVCVENCRCFECVTKSLRVENKQLREALRNRVVTFWLYQWRCDLCGGRWGALAAHEMHTFGCLAAPEE